MIEAQPSSHTSKLQFLIAFALVAIFGIALRIYPSASYTAIGYDEELYRRYVTVLSAHGLTSYPEIMETYVAQQRALSSVSLPPTRFLYIFSGYVWHEVTGAAPMTALRTVSCLFSILLFFAAAVFAWRLGGRELGLAVFVLMSCAPTQIHMAQHALIDGFFAFWATLCLWFLWENLQRPNHAGWLAAFTAALSLMVMTKENAAFAYFGILVLLAANRWLRFGTVTPKLLLLTAAGPLVGFVVLVTLCGGLDTFVTTYRLLTAKASVFPYAIATGDGPWYRYLVDLLLISPVVFLLAVGSTFRVRRDTTSVLYLLIFVAATYLVMCNVRYGMNLRYTNMWDMPLRYLAVVCIAELSATLAHRRSVIMWLVVVLVSLFDLRQYYTFFVAHNLYELVTGGLLRALQILK